ncbi:flagellar hook-associated protein 1 FlgK [Caulobacter ginsengisoli]|uniref:Flagellar hook-associated protein 1 n=1 Tax=Caulobacter ginsengisoli TaxID=400775 RepID=A0ABU0IPM6_9CAUL|nr:flagellar hook-associated protein FlgK [Caulobacter ginsengisoli]MDQ0463336.1 flagellar hook-associated protein 1 FlgK [Caulobacter ginsengisoli]
MSLNTILSVGTSGLLTAQTGLRVVSDNISNANTPGYVRKTVNQVSLATNGMGTGVGVAGIDRVANKYLQSASLASASDAGAAAVLSQYLDNAQAMFGDPSGDNSYFSGLDDVYTAFSGAADSPASQLLRSQALSRVQTFLSDSDRITASLGTLAKQADTQIAADVDSANDLLKQIASLNADIARSKSMGGDASGSENIQSGLVDQLGKLLDIQVSMRATGGVNLRAGDGTILVGTGVATLSYNRTDSGAGAIQVTALDSTVPAITARISGGEIKGLLDLRNTELPGMSAQLGEFVSQAVEELNRAHNAASSVPAPASLTGKDIGLDLPTAVSGFTGTTTVALVSGAGLLQHKIAIDFTAGTMSLDGGGAAAFTPASFLATLNGQLGANGSASFTGGALTISATGGAGVVIADDPTTPSLKASQGFSQFFGMNDLINSTGYSYVTGLRTSDPHGFTPGDQIKLRLTDANGARLRDVPVTVPAAGTMQNLLDTLNDPTTGVGLYGAFALDPDGRMAFTANTGSGVALSVLSDDTERGVGGPSMTALFGIGAAERGGRASRYTLDPSITGNPNLLAMAKLDPTAAVGVSVLALGDGRGGVGLAQAGETTTNFSSAGGFGAVSMTVSRYASEFGGHIGRKADNADTALRSAQAVKDEADARRQSVEGVNLDEELVNMTTYQQAFNASARVITAAKDMYDVLLAML